MQVTRIYSGDDGQSHFEDLDLPLRVTEVGAMSTSIPIESMFVRSTAEAGPETWDYHVAPRRQFALHLDRRDRDRGRRRDGETVRAGRPPPGRRPDRPGSHQPRGRWPPAPGLRRAGSPEVDLDRWRT